MEQTPRATFPSVKRKKTTNQRPGNRNHSLIRHSNVWRHLIGPFQSDDDERLLLFFLHFLPFFFVSFAQQKKNKGRSYWPVDFFFAFFFWRRFPFASSFFFSFSGQRDAPSANRMPKRHALHDLEPLIGATATAVIAVNNNNNNNNSNSNNNPTNPVKLGTDNKKTKKNSAT